MCDEGQCHWCAIEIGGLPIAGAPLCPPHQRRQWLKTLAKAGWSQIGWMALMERRLATREWWPLKRIL